MPILFIEGLPGSGKTTFAKRVESFLKEHNKATVMAQEGELHPIDLAWCSYMDPEDFDALLEKYSHLKEDILKHTKYVGNKVITAYTRVPVDKKDKSFYGDFETYEIYKQKSLDDFLFIHVSLYEEFALNMDSSVFYIFECVLLQNHINELILAYNQTKNQILKYYNTLTQSLKNKDCTVFYIKQENIDTTLSRIIEERRSPDKEMYKDWIDLVVDYWGTQPYAKELGYQGVDGVYSYFKDRQQIELEVLQRFPLEHKVLSLNQDYDAVFNELKSYIKQKWL
jgi:hypothetical protein